ncbi:MAG: hypothetical protein M3Q10_08080 [Chloroflexota bacterium]|nr:hypothetical protein [Chloroflexota bacterium]
MSRFGAPSGLDLFAVIVARPLLACGAEAVFAGPTSISCNNGVCTTDTWSTSNSAP